MSYFYIILRYLSDNETLFRKIQRGFEAFEISLLVYLLRLITMYIWHVIGVLRFLGVAPTVVTTPMKSTPRHCGIFTLARPPCALTAKPGGSAILFTNQK